MEADPHTQGLEVLGSDTLSTMLMGDSLDSGDVLTRLNISTKDVFDT